jgi:bacterioferritin-associated ferredoxin
MGDGFSATASDFPGWPATMTRCECAGISFAEVARRVREEGLSLDEVAERTGCGRTCSACLPDLRSHLGKGRGAAGNPIGSG